jgi:hypothetical protein
VDNPETQKTLRTRHGTTTRQNKKKKKKKKKKQTKRIATRISATNRGESR